MDKASKSKKACEPGKILNPETGNCVLINGRIGKKILKSRGIEVSVSPVRKTSKSPIKSTRKLKVKSPMKSPRKLHKKSRICKDDEIINPATGYCAKKNGRLGKQILKSRGTRVSVSPVRKTRKTPIKSIRKNRVCKDDEIINPSSGYCVKKSGKIGLSLLLKSKGSAKGSAKGSPKNDYQKICPKGKILNPASGLCVKEDSLIGLQIRAGLIKSRKVPSLNIKYVDEDVILHPISGRPIFKDSKTGKLILSGRIKAVDIPAVKYISPDISLSPTIDNCIKRSQLKLKPYQVRAVKYMKRNKSLLIVFGTGCGKTLTAVTISQCFLDKNPNKKVILVAPSTLIANFEKEMDNYGVINKDRYEFYSFDSFSRHARLEDIDMKGNMIIIDEVHNLRSPHGVRTINTINACSKAEKRVLLTATPFVNSYSDLIPIINILHGEFKITGKSVSLDNITKFLKNKVIVEDCYDPKFFPKRIDKTLEIEMTEDYYERYLIETEHVQDNHSLFADPQKFYNGNRRAVNKLGPEYFSQKIQSVSKIIKNGKCIIYSNWLEYGVNAITKELNKNKISYGMFTGDTPIKERKEILDEFNAGKLNVLIVSKVGGEGIDTKEVRSVIVVDPPWNDTLLHQIVSRAIRYKSHINLSPSKRVVTVYFLKMVKPKSYKKMTASILKTGDEILYDIIENKKIHNNNIMLELAKISIK